MNRPDLIRLRQEADRQRSDFMTGLAEVKKRLAPLRVIDDTIRSGDSELEFLRRTTLAVQKNPAWVLAILAAVWLLFEDARPRKTSRSRITSRKLPIPRKETTNGREQIEGC